MVEMGGIEPPSEKTSTVMSTRIVADWFLLHTCPTTNQHATSL